LEQYVNDKRRRESAIISSETNQAINALENSSDDKFNPDSPREVRFQNFPDIAEN
jgi:hypothetical protein